MSQRLEIIIPGQPRPWSRPMPQRRVKFIAMVTDPAYRKWKRGVVEIIRNHLSRSGQFSKGTCVRLDCEFVFARKTSHPKVRRTARIRHCCKPDRDNLEKAIMDALTECHAWHDDGQACTGTIEKFYAAVGEEPHSRVILQAIPAE